MVLGQDNISQLRFKEIEVQTVQEESDAEHEDSHMWEDSNAKKLHVQELKETSEPCQGKPTLSTMHRSYRDFLLTDDLSN